MTFLNCIFKLFLSVLALSVPWAIEAQSLSGTSVILGRKHYYIETTNTANFFEAAHNCAQYDMTLASIENKNEHLSLVAILTKTENLGKTYWISGTSYGTTAAPYRWLGNGKAVSYIPNTAVLTWAASQCLSTVASSFDYDNSVACTTQLYFICEKLVEPNCGKYGQCRYTYSSSSK